MFEKEAEEILNNYCDCELLPECISGIRCRCSDFEEKKKLLLEGIEFGYNKANEWHYVKDGDLPPLNTNVLVIHRWARTPEVGKRIEVFINSSVWVWAMCSDRYRYTSDDENVIAWKEIVLPELEG